MSSSTPRNLPPEIAFEPPDLEEKYGRAVRGFMRRIRDLYEAIHERFGEEGLELIREVSRRYGHQIGENASKKRSIKGLSEVGTYLLKVFEMVGGDWHVKELTEERMVIAVSRCPYPFANPEVCRAHTCMEQALVQTLDDTLEHSVGRCIPAGDPECEHILSRRS